MLTALVNPSKRLMASATAALHQAWKVASLVSLHMTLQLVFAIEQLSRRAASNAAFQDFGTLTSRGNRFDI